MVNAGAAQGLCTNTGPSGCRLLLNRQPLQFDAMSPEKVKLRRVGQAPSTFTNKSRWIVTLTLSLTATLVYIMITDANPREKHRFQPPHPIRRVAPHPEGRSHDLNADADGRGKVCFGPVSDHSSPKPWNTCKRTFVEPTVTLVSPPRDNVTLGDTIHYRIESNVVPDRQCVSGGNLWFAVLASAAGGGSPDASASGFVVDHCNGSYDLFAVAAWTGRAALNLTLVHTGDAVNHLRNVVWPAWDRVSFIGTFRPDNVTTKNWPKSTCVFRGPGNWTGFCQYKHPKAMGETMLACKKIDNVPCDTLYTLKSHGARIEGSVTRLTEDVAYLFARPYSYHPVQSSNTSLTIKGTGELVRNLPRCRIDQPVPQFQGYWKQGVWHSLLCAMRTDWLEQKNLGQCVRNKHVVLLGDSTTRQWFDALRRLLSGFKAVQPPGDNYYFHMERDYEDLNATVVFQMHPHVLSSYSANIKDTVFEVDVLDGLDDPACNYIVVISPWAHFIQWTHDSYVVRTQLIRAAVIRFRRRCPDAPIVLKGPHPRHHDTSSAIIYGNDYLISQVGLINQETFRGIGVWFLPLWDINLAHPSRNVVHMPMEVVRQELKMLLGLVCETH